MNVNASRPAANGQPARADMLRLRLEKVWRARSTVGDALTVLNCQAEIETLASPLFIVLSADASIMPAEAAKAESGALKLLRVKRGAARGCVEWRQGAVV
eukprot:5397036-Pleurochrysis_carterae.AAC.1